MRDLTPLTSEAMREAGLRAVRKAEEAQNRALRRAIEIEAEARRHVQLHEYSKLSWWDRLWTKPEDIEVSRRLVSVVANAWIGGDAKWNVAVSDNKWYLSQAAAYGANAYGASG